MKAHAIDRRSFLKTAAAAGLATSTALTPEVASAAAAPVKIDNAGAGPSVIALADANIVETVYGKVRGSQRNGISIFKGIPYGTDTGGKNRFQPAQKPQSWAGIRNALWYKYVCPAAPRDDWEQDEHAYLFQWDDGQPGEDCLHVNLWTPGINDNKKRPVMVWMHGGGFTSGSGQESRAYDGENLARRGDAVVVSFNHRLNVFGFLNLSELHPDYAASGNVGMTDIVFLLQWVRDNIANFGGDPGNVTIMGQSGGGGKVCTLLAMPSAQGLFHKASIHSGASLRIYEKPISLATAAAVLAELGITSANLDKLHTIDTNQLLNAGIAALAKGSGTSGPPAQGPRRPPVRVGFSPYVDGVAIPRHPFDPAAPDISANVPILVGNVLNELVNAIDMPDAFSMTDAQLASRLGAIYGSGPASELITSFHNAHPHSNPFQLWSIISATATHRVNSVILAQRKAALGKAPAYNFWFHFQPPVLNGRPMAFHLSDLSFFFNNVARCETMTGNSLVAQKLGEQMTDAWIAFARTGNPNHPGIPRWSPVAPTGSQTMIFGDWAHYHDDPDSEQRKLLASMPA